MFTNFQPAPHCRYPLSTRELRSLCKEARSIEEMALSWCQPDRSLLISRESPNSNKITFVFLRKRKVLGTVLARVEMLLDQYPQVEAVDRHFMKEVEGFRPHEGWFLERQRRLELQFVKLNETNVAPPEAVGELVTSYCLAEIGYAEIKAGRASGIEPHNKSLQLSLVCVHPESQTGWSEQFHIDRAQLGYSVQLQLAVKAGQIH